MCALCAPRCFLVAPAPGILLHCSYPACIPPVPGIALVSGILCIGASHWLRASCASVHPTGSKHPCIARYRYPAWITLALDIAQSQCFLSIPPAPSIRALLGASTLPASHRLRASHRLQASLALLRAGTNAGHRRVPVLPEHPAAPGIPCIARCRYPASIPLTPTIPLASGFPCTARCPYLHASLQLRASHALLGAGNLHASPRLRTSHCPALSVHGSVSGRGAAAEPGWGGLRGGFRAGAERPQPPAAAAPPWRPAPGPCPCCGGH